MKLGHLSAVKTLNAFILALPLLTKLVEHKSAIPYPPLSDDTLVWRLFTVILAGLSAAIPYYLLPEKPSRKLLYGLFIAFFLSCVVYLSLQDKTIVSVTFSDGSASYFTKGSERNPALREPYASMSDEELLKHSGLTDADRKLAWTADSLFTNRMTLFFSYTLSFMLMEFLIGSMARIDPNIGGETTSNSSDNST